VGAARAFVIVTKYSNSRIVVVVVVDAPRTSWRGVRLKISVSAYLEEQLPLAADSEEEKESLVKDVFDSVASKDMNDAISLGVRRSWTQKKKAGGPRRKNMLTGRSRRA
jgi:hypothetical protein